MYQTAIKRTQEARSCLEAGDICGRARAITKASNILLELRASLKPEAGDIALNLDRLYRYLQLRLQEAHMKQKAEPLTEVERIMRVLLDAWEKADAAERAKTEIAAVGRKKVAEPKAFSPYSAGIFDSEPVATLALSA